jgi:hypothetical protein
LGWAREGSGEVGDAGAPDEKKIRQVERKAWKRRRRRRRRKRRKSGRRKEECVKVERHERRRRGWEG